MDMKKTIDKSSVRTDNNASIAKQAFFNAHQAKDTNHPPDSVCHNLTSVNSEWCMTRYLIIG